MLPAVRRIAAKIRNVFFRGRAEREMTREIEAHLRLLEDDFRSAGLSPNDARTAARRVYGGVEQTKELHREERSIPWLDHTLQDLRHAWRGLVKSPVFFVVATLTLALGIGANTVIFSIINVVLLHPLPYPAADRLVSVSSADLPAGITVISVPKSEMVAERVRAFDGAGAFYFFSAGLTTRGAPEQVIAARASLDFLPLLGVAPAIGRGFMPDEERAGGADVALITDSFWHGHLGGDPAAIGKSIPIDGRSTVVVGVLPASFRFPFAQPEPEIWMPRVFDNPQYTMERIRIGAAYLLMFGRLRPSATMAQAQVEVDAAAKLYKSTFPGAVDADRGLRVEPLEKIVLGNLRLSLLALFAAVGFVLLIACANVANLLLSRATAREREIAVRRALGATRGRLIRQLLTESALLSFFGGGLGVVLAWRGVPPLMAAVAPGTIPLAGEIHVDLTVLLFAAAICCLTALGFGLLPAFQIARQELHDKLKDGGRGSTGERSARMRRLMVISEVALAVVLTTGAGLLLRSLVKLSEVSPGFVASNVVTFPFALPPSRYPQSAQRTEFFRKFLENVRELHGVQSAGLISHLPLTGFARYIFFCIDGVPCQGVGKGPIASWRQTSPDYFATMRIRVLRGRDFDERDLANSTRVAAINQTIADRYFAGVNPIGRHVMHTVDMIPLEIVAVVSDTKFSALNAPNSEEIYVPYPQAKWPNMALAVRSNSPPQSLIAAVRKTALALDPELPLAGIQTLDDLVSGSIAQPKLIAALAGTFAVFALFLAAIGIYGVMAYLVTQRSKEMAIRMALGARRTAVFQLVAGQGLKLVAAGIALGILSSLALTRLLATMLFGTSATDALTLTAVSILFVLVALAACYVPARRAMQVDPQTALRCQ